MAEAVKRRYRSELRRAQAEQTRARILDAAGDLFEANGYTGTTVRQVAEAAGVAVDTVYATFGSKPRILTALIDRRLAPAGQQSVLDRPEAIAVRDESDQRRQVHLFARDIAATSARARPFFQMLRTAAEVEPDLAPVYREMEASRARNMGEAARWFAARGPLRVPVDRAADTIWALASPDTARLLCEIGGWTVDEYATWLEDALVRTLLPDAEGPTRRA